jgi:uncharacterized protein
MLHPATELRFISKEIGYGVFATEFIPQGTVTWVRDRLDKTLSPTEFFNMSAASEVYREQLTKYAYRDEAGDYVLCWDLGRFMNHSCNPSCLGFNQDFELAVRDIQPGEELTSDYSTFYLSPEESFACGCSSLKCREFVTPDDIKTHSDRWYDLMSEAFDLLPLVSQPLDSLLTNEYKERAVKNLSNRQKLVAC